MAYVVGLLLPRNMDLAMHEAGVVPDCEACLSVVSDFSNFEKSLIVIKSCAVAFPCWDGER